MLSLIHLYIKLHLTCTCKLYSTRRALRRFISNYSRKMNIYCNFTVVNFSMCTYQKQKKVHRTCLENMINAICHFHLLSPSLPFFWLFYKQLQFCDGWRTILISLRTLVRISIQGVHWKTWTTLKSLLTSRSDSWLI